MKKILLFTFLGGMIALGCSDADNETDGTTATEPPTLFDSMQGTLPAPVEECYQLIVGRDTFSVSFTIDNNQVVGTSEENHFEKDDSRGSFSGTYDEATRHIHAWYHFMSEGITSYRQIVFRREENGLVPGQGDEVHNGDSAYFRDPDNLEFNTGNTYRKIDCPN